jgi:general secretion pathway protein J
MNRRHRGFTLLELTVALVLLALLAAVLFGSLGLAGTSLERGEAKADTTSNMRLAQAFLRSSLEEQHPLRMRKIAEFPLLFGGERDELHYAAILPARVAGGGIWFYRLSLAGNDARSPLLLERMLPDLNALQPPEFREVERTELATGIRELKIGYYGRDPGAADASEPTWRDRWDDPQRLPILLRIDVTPKEGPAWPTLVVSPRDAPEAGCRAWDPARLRCVSM